MQIPAVSNDAMDVNLHQKGEFIEIVYELPEEQSSSVRVFDVQGINIYNYQQLSPKGENILSIPTDKWVVGIYFIQVQTSEGISIKKWVKS